MSDNKPNRDRAVAMLASLGRGLSATPRLDRARRMLDDRCREAGIPLPSKTIAIVGPFNAETERRVRHELSDCWRRRGVLLKFDSPGGRVSVADGITQDLRDLKRNFGVEVTAVTRGMVGSAAVTPWLAASSRICGPQSRFVLHHAAIDVSGFELTSATSTRLRRMADLIDIGDRKREALFRQQLALTPEQQVIIRRGNDLRLCARGAVIARLVSFIDYELPERSFERILGGTMLPWPAK